MNIATTSPVVLYACRVAKVTVIVDEGIVSMLTGCCAASAKGTEHGVVCRACHRALPPLAGAAALVGQPMPEFVRAFRRTVEEFGCPAPEVCAADANHAIEEHSVEVHRAQIDA